MSESEIKHDDKAMTEEEQKRVNSREHLWRAALWAGFAHGEQIVMALQNNQRPWFNELAPLTAEERVFIMGQICKQFFPEMTGENEKKAFLMLGKLYGVKKNRVMRRLERNYAH